MIALNLVLGMVAGYCISSLVESVLHQYVSDALPRYVKAWMRFPRLLKPLINTYYSHHTVHHIRTFRSSHVEQFRTEEDKQKLIAELTPRGRHGRTIMAGAFGAKLHGEGAIVFVTPLVVFFPLFWVLTKSVAFLIGGLTLLLPAVMSNFIHPYLHMPFEKGQQTAPRLIAWFLRTRYARAVYENHFLHHRYGGTSNFNLILGADYLRGKVRKPNAKDLAVMTKIGMPLPKRAAASSPESRPAATTAHDYVESLQEAVTSASRLVAATVSQ